MGASGGGCLPLERVEKLDVIIGFNEEYGENGTFNVGSRPSEKVIFHYLWLRNIRL